MRLIVEQLKALRHGDASPNPEWVAHNRATLLSQIKNTVPVVKAGEQAKRFGLFENVWSGLSIFLPRTLVYNVIRPIAVLLIVALVGTSGWIASVDASYEAQPGDFSYTVLRAAQKTQVAVAQLIGDKNGETKLHLKFANSIASKTRQVVKADGPKKGAQLAVAMADLKSELNSLNSKLDETKIDGNDGDMEATVAMDVKENSEQIKGVLQEVKADLLTNSSTVGNAALTKEVSDAKDLVKDVSVNAMGVMVAKLNSGDNSVSVADVKQALDTSLTAAATDVVESKQAVEGIRTSAPTDAATKAVAAASAVTISVDQKISEATKLLSGTSTQAFAKIVTTLAEVNQDAKQAEKISDNALLAAQAALPALPSALNAASSSLTAVSGTPALNVTTTGSVSTGTASIKR